MQRGKKEHDPLSTLYYFTSTLGEGQGRREAINFNLGITNRLIDVKINIILI